MYAGGLISSASVAGLALNGSSHHVPCIDWPFRSATRNGLGSFHSAPNSSMWASFTVPFTGNFPPRFWTVPVT